MSHAIQHHLILSCLGNSCTHTCCRRIGAAIHSFFTFKQLPSSVYWLRNSYDLTLLILEQLQSDFIDTGKFTIPLYQYWNSYNPTVLILKQLQSHFIDIETVTIPVLLILKQSQLPSTVYLYWNSDHPQFTDIKPVTIHNFLTHVQLLDMETVVNAQTLTEHWLVKPPLNLTWSSKHCIVGTHMLICWCTLLPLKVIWLTHSLKCSAEMLKITARGYLT